MALRKRRFYLSLIISISLLCSCDEPPTPTSPWPTSVVWMDAYDIPYLLEDFEDGDLTNNPTWQSGSVTPPHRTKGVVGSSGDGFFLLLDGPIEGADLQHKSGYGLSLMRHGDGIQPDMIGFQVFAWPRNYLRSGYFVLEGYNPNSAELETNTAIEFYIDENHEFHINGASYGPISQFWHTIEFREFYWPEDPQELPRFNLQIDEIQVGDCLQFIEPVASFTKLNVYNYADGYTGYDKIYASEDVETDTSMVCAPPPPPPPPAPQPESGPYGFIAIAKQPAACRQGPANEYPEVDFVEEEFTAPVLGRNEEDTWFVVTGPNWGEDCWIWEGLLETTGDINPVPVLPNPPLILPDSDGSGSDSEGPSACLVKQLGSKAKCVSPCPPNADPGTPCTP